MKRFAAIGAVAALVLCVPGCGGPDALMREFIANVNGYAETLEKRESRDKQTAALERVRTTIEKINNLKVSDEEKAQLIARYKSEIKRSKERIEEAHKAIVMEGGTTDAPDLFGDINPK